MSMFIFRRDHAPGVYRVFMRDTNERIGLAIHNPHTHKWDAHWGVDGESFQLCGEATTRERAGSAIFMHHLQFVARNAIEAMRELAIEWHTYPDYIQTVLYDELEQLRDASALLVTKIEEHFA